MTKPSRRTSKGRDCPLVDSAVMLPKAASATGVIAASAPPASTASQRPVAIRRWAARIECVPDAQAVVIVSHGPRQPRRIETVAAAGVRHHHRHEERGHPARAFLQQHADLGLHRAEAPDAGANLDTGERRVDVELAGIVKRHLGGGDGELGEAVDAARFFGIEP